MEKSEHRLVSVNIENATFFVKIRHNNVAVDEKIMQNFRLKSTYENRRNLWISRNAYAAMIARKEKNGQNYFQMNKFLLLFCWIEKVFEWIRRTTE